MIHFPGGLMGKAMRDVDETSRSLFSYVDIEDYIPARHPLRKIRQVVNDAMVSLDADFAALYVDFGRPDLRCANSHARASRCNVESSRYRFVRAMV